MSFFDEIDECLIEYGPSRAVWMQPSFEEVQRFFEEGGTHEEVKYRIKKFSADEVFIGFGHDGLDLKVLKYLITLHTDKNYNNFYVEAGANNGILQSNTCILDWGLDWKGVLIEPVKANALSCVKYRPTADIWQAALVSHSYNKKYIEGTFKDSIIEIKDMSSGLGAGCTDEHLKNNPELVAKACARTLTEILQKSNAPKNIGFLSLDVEGYEMEALHGLDFDKFQPALILLEIGPEKDETLYHQFLENHGYGTIEKLTEKDYLYFQNGAIHSANYYKIKGSLNEQRRNN